MSEILDPEQIRNFIPDRVVYEIAESLAYNPSVHTVLSPEFATDKIAELCKDPVYRGQMERLKVVTGLLGLSALCVYPILKDGRGRSENHIAGEVCRIAKTLRSVAVLYKIPELEHFYMQGGKSVKNIEMWFPEETIFPCPTIDERKCDDSLVLSSTGYGLGCMLIPSIHRQWELNFREGTLPGMSTGSQKSIKQLQAPFVLDSGGVVTVDAPKFYKLSDGSGAGEEVAPRELVGV